MATHDLTIHEPRSGRQYPVRNMAIALGRWLRGPRGYIAAGVLLSAGGLALGWSWLAAVGVLPILFSALPCVAMCALGICMMPRGRSSCAKPEATDQSQQSRLPGPPLEIAGPQER